MSQQLINIGAAPDDGTGDKLRDAFDKVNDNFTELYDDRDDYLEPVTALQNDLAALDTRVDATLDDNGTLKPGVVNSQAIDPEYTANVNARVRSEDLANNTDAEKGSSLVGVYLAGGYGTTVNRLAYAVTPAMFGAAGDGVTDDTAAFTRLAAYLAANNGGTVVAPRRYYLPGGFKIATDNVVFDGDNRGEIICGGKTGEAFSGENRSFITIKNITLSLPQSNLRTDKFCVLFTNSNNLLFENVKTNYGVVGIWTVQCNDVMVKGCRINTPKADGIHFGHGSKRCKASGNTVISPGDDAFSTTYYTGYSRPQDITFVDNTVIGTIWGAGVAVYSGDRVLVANNNISNTAIYGIVVATHEDGGDPKNVIVNGNIISGACYSTIVPNNYWFGTPDEQVTSESHKSAIAAQGTDICISNNQISQVVASNGDSRRGMYLSGGTRITINNNEFKDIKGDGINCGGVAISQLTISGNTFDQVLGIAIRAVAPVTDSMLIDGNSSGYGQTLNNEPFMIYVNNSGATGALVSNNTSSSGRGVAIDPTATGVTEINNNAGPKAFTAFTPAVGAAAGTIASGSATAYFLQIGKVVHYRANVRITSNGTGSNAVTVSLPVAARQGTGVSSMMAGREGALTGKMLSGICTGSLLFIRYYDNSYPGADGAMLEISGTYESI